MPGVPRPHVVLTAAFCWLLLTLRASITSFSSKPISIREMTACRRGRRLRAVLAGPAATVGSSHGTLAGDVLTVQSLVWEDPMCSGAMKPVCHPQL